MTLAGRIGYAIRAAQKSRSLSVNPLASSTFFLLPERLASWVQPVCRFRHHGLEFYARRSDWGSVDHVLLSGEYDFTDRLLEGCERPHVLDVGANIGTFALFVFGLRPSAVVHSVEPSTAVYQILERNQRANPTFNWRTSQRAVWSSNGPTAFQTSGLASTQGHISEGGNQPVEALTLSRLLAEYVGTGLDLLKLDIEGAEEKVLCTGEHGLGLVKQAIVQVHPNRANPAVVETVLRRAFGFVFRVKGRQSVNPLWIAARTPLGAPFEPL